MKVQGGITPSKDSKTRTRAKSLLLWAKNSHPKPNPTREEIIYLATRKLHWSLTDVRQELKKHEGVTTT